MKRVTAKVKPLYEDDFGLTGYDLRMLPFPGGRMLVTFRSYQRVCRERKAEGMKSPRWESLERYYR
jgi:hypothetical protein